LQAALAFFEEAIRIDPGYARAHVGRADALSTMAAFSYLPFDSGFRQSREAALRAIELAPDLAEGYLSLSFIQSVVDFDLEASRASAERALKLNPGSFYVQQSYGFFQSSLGHHEAAIGAARKATELDPLTTQAHVTLSVVLRNGRQYDEAEAAARRALDLAPDRPTVHAQLGLVLLGKLCTANRAAPDQGRCSNSRHEEKPNLIAGMELWRDSPRFSLVFDFTRDTDARAAAIVV
jgi:tetratricopeptide (TPR) repeat protein